MEYGIFQRMTGVYEKIIGLKEMFFVKQCTPADICREFEASRYRSSNEILDILRQQKDSEKVDYHGRSGKASAVDRGTPKGTHREVRSEKRG